MCAWRREHVWADWRTWSTFAFKGTFGSSWPINPSGQKGKGGQRPQLMWSAAACGKKNGWEMDWACDGTPENLLKTTRYPLSVPVTSCLELACGTTELSRVISVFAMSRWNPTLSLESTKENYRSHQNANLFHLAIASLFWFHTTSF